MDLKIVPAFNYKEEIKILFKEYTDMLVNNDPVFSKYLEQQNYDKEIDNLEEKYAPPMGRLYIAFSNQEVVGCIALKQMNSDSGELKRLYVRKKFRKAGIGSILVDKIISDAKEIGYTYLKLDTLPFLKEAIHIYEAKGFEHIEKYNDSPMESGIYMQYKL